MSSSALRRGDLFSLTKLRDARNFPKGKVNIIGIVLEHGFPRQSNGTGQLSAVFNKKYTSFALYDGKEGSSPYQTSDRFREKDLDKIYVTDMRRWFMDFQLDQSSDNFSIRQLVEGENFDLFCKVLYVHETGNQQTAFVWDGSDAPPAKIHKKLVDEMHQPLALHLESFSLAREIVCSFPTVGSVIRVVFQDIETNYLPLLRVGKWIKLANLICEVHNGLWRVVLTQYSRICYGANDEKLKPEPQRLYEDRISVNSRNMRMPQWSLPWQSRITEIDIVYGEEFNTLMDVLTSTEVMAKFKCVVRVLSVLPCKAAAYLFPDGINKIRLTLEDPTTRLHAYLYAEEGVTFFDGSSSVEELSRKRNKLLGMSANLDGEETDGAPRNPPWVQVSLVAEYQVEGVPDSRQYRLCSTRLTGFRL